jgi:periplasmic copper chaperone A
MRLLNSAAASAALLVGLVSGDATAHVTANPNQATADSWFRTALRVSHGCEGTPTVAVRVKMPDGVLAVRPQMKPGWEISISQRKLDQPIEGPHGTTVTEVVDEVAWRGGPLPDAYFDEFGLSMRLPAEQATLYFPTVQECEEGVHRWIEIPSAGQEWGDLDEPAPFVTVKPKE